MTIQKTKKNYNDEEKKHMSSSSTRRKNALRVSFLYYLSCVCVCDVKVTEIYFKKKVNISTTDSFFDERKN